MHTTFIHESFAECEFCIKHQCGLCDKPHPEVQVHDGINSKWPSDKRKRCPTCAMCMTCGVSKVPDRKEITHDREIRSLSVHITVRDGMDWLVDRTCESCLLANPHWKCLMENPLNLTYRLPKDFREKTGK
jgi:hypothetical protein